jgi:hypothetical protein
VPPASAKLHLTRLTEEIVALLAEDPSAQVTVTLEVQASFPAGVPDHVRRGVAENAKVLKLMTAEWE